MNKHNLNLSDKCLTPDKYKYSLDPPKNLKLNDKVISYFNGIDWCIVQLDIMLAYPVLYDTFTVVENMMSRDNVTGIETKNDIDNKKNMTISMCPYSLSTCAYEGKFYPTEFLMYNCLVLKNSDDQYLPIFTGYLAAKDNDGEKPIKRWEVDIGVYKNIMIEHPDSVYITVDEPYKQLLDADFYSNNDIYFVNSEDKKSKNELMIHPKTLVYVINYRSSSSQDNRHTIILGNDAEIDNVTGFNIEKSGFLKYKSEMRDEIINRCGFIIPVLWYVWEDFYPNSKVITL